MTSANTTTTNERVFIIGGTGNVGTKCVQVLLNKNIPVTLLSRTPEKVAALYPGVKEDALKVVQGDYDSHDVLKAAIPGHTRLFVLVHDIDRLEHIKVTLANLAYDAGIQQILDISSSSVNDPWRSTHLGYQGYLAEKAVLRAAGAGPNRTVVTLRPGRFMSNIITYDRPGQDRITDHVAPDAKQGWISPNDIGTVAALILSDDIGKHGNAVYNMLSQVVTPTERAAILTRVLGRPITYQQITPQEKFNGLSAHLGFLSFPAIYHLALLTETLTPTVTIGLPILLGGREPETLEEYLEANKHKLA